MYNEGVLGVLTAGVPFPNLSYRRKVMSKDFVILFLGVFLLVFVLAADGFAEKVCALECTKLSCTTASPGDCDKKM